MLRIAFLFILILSHLHAHAQKELWGMTASNGTQNGVIFKTDSVGNNYSDVYTFSNTINGLDPYGSLMQSSDGNLYGMTSRGGVSDFGVIFKVDIKTGAYTKVHDFDSVGGKTPYGALCEAANGKLYGMTYAGGVPNGFAIDRGVIFEYDMVTNTFTKLEDFNFYSYIAYPYGSFVKGSDGLLYGLSSVGGVDATGHFFKYDTQLDSIIRLESFIAGSNFVGVEPYGAVVEASDSNFYGLSRDGGAGTVGGGVIFKYDASAPIFKKMTKVHNFSEVLPKSVDGYDLVGSLVEANGKLYGMTRKGGIDSAGTIFEYDIANKTFIKVHDFDSTSEGYAPNGSLTLASDGLLYGLITSEGGQARMFSFNTSTNTLNIKTDITGTPYYTQLLEAAPKPTSIEVYSNEQFLEIYPNPASDKLHLNTAINSAKVEVYDVQGRLVIEQDWEKGSFVDLSKVKAGIYNMRLSKDDNLHINRVLIVQKL